MLFLLTSLLCYERVYILNVIFRRIVFDLFEKFKQILLNMFIYAEIVIESHESTQNINIKPKTQKHPRKYIFMFEGKLQSCRN